MAIHKKIVTVDRKVLDYINTCLTVEPVSADKCLGENESVSVTANFGGGMEMDIKCCGAQYREKESNLAWTEAVLFNNGSQVAFTDVCDTFEGEWTLEYDNDTYVVYIAVAD